MQRRQILRWGCGLMAAGASTTAWTRQPAAAPVWRERALLGLGTTLWLKAAHPSAERADAALDAAVRAIRDVERQMSLFNADSALQRLNAAGRLDRPEPALRSVLTLSREIARRSNGAFDISMQPLWQLWSAAAAQGALPSAQALQRTRQAVNWRALEVSTDAIRLNLRGMQLSLNGIAQGYAADSARDALIAHGIEHAWIDTGETALLGTLAGNHGVVLDQVASSHPVKVVVEIGHAFTLHTAAPAKAMLAHWSPEAQKTFVQQMKFTKHTRHTITNATAFHAELKQASKTGYALDRGEESETFACVAAPVFDHRSHPVASIWISGPSDRVTPGNLDKLGQKVKQFADQLSRQLGYHARESGS